MMEYYASIKHLFTKRFQPEENIWNTLDPSIWDIMLIEKDKIVHSMISSLQMHTPVHTHIQFQKKLHDCNCYFIFKLFFVISKNSTKGVYNFYSEVSIVYDSQCSCEC